MKRGRGIYNERDETQNITAIKNTVVATTV
jgi:hypothetical protein